MNYTLYFDGSCYPTSPGGLAVSGFVLQQEDTTVESFSGIIGLGLTTSLMAEYRAVAEGLRAFHARWIFGVESLTIRGDSKVVINQLNGRFAQAPKYLQEYYVAQSYLSQIRDLGIQVNLEWIPRTNNAADDVCKRFRSSLPQALGDESEGNKL
jgi:ribonuclease HI